MASFHQANRKPFEESIVGILNFEINMARVNIYIPVHTAIIWYALTISGRYRLGLLL